MLTPLAVFATSHTLILLDFRLKNVLLHYCNTKYASSLWTVWIFFILTKTGRKNEKKFFHNFIGKNDFRSAALRKLCQYEDCLRDIARAARFGYPKENMFKLWERKAKCYQGIKRYDMASKCLRQAIQVWFLSKEVLKCLVIIEGYIKTYERINGTQLSNLNYDHRNFNLCS